MTKQGGRGGGPSRPRPSATRAAAKPKKTKPAKPAKAKPLRERSARNHTRRLTIAIDGPAGAGKSTAARRLAAALGYTYVDSGAMYRAVGLATRRHGVDPDDGDAVAALVTGVTFLADGADTRVLLDGEDVTAALRVPDAGGWASRVAALPQVRAQLVDRQRALAADGGVVMDGRDIGTVVFPHAECKFFLTASSDARARRRQAQDEGNGVASDLAATRAEIDERDRRDRERAVAPLRVAPDAVIIDNSALSADAVVARMLEEVRTRARP